MPQHFAPVWLTTDKQLGALTTVYKEASFATRLMGTFRFPPGTPHLQGALMPWMRVPIAFVAAGELELSADALEFTARPYRLFGWAVRGVKNETRFRIPRAEVLAVEAADFPSPVAGRFDIPFTRVRTTRPGGLDNLLFCSGGRFSMKGIRTRSLELRAALAFAQLRFKP